MSNNGRPRLVDGQGRPVGRPTPPGLCAMLVVNAAHMERGIVMVPPNFDGGVSVRLQMSGPTLFEISLSHVAQIDAIVDILTKARKRLLEEQAKVKLVPPGDELPPTPATDP